MNSSWKDNPFFSPMARFAIGEVHAFDFSMPILEIPSSILSNDLHGKGVKIFALAACCAPPGTGKRIPAEHMIDRALETGRLEKSGKVVEPTSGGTGHALAFMAERKGFKFTGIVSDDLQEGKCTPILNYGATLLTESKVAHAVRMDKSIGSIELAKLYAAKVGAFNPNQYWNPDIAGAWENLIAPQAWDLIGSNVTEACFGLGSCGTIAGFHDNWKPRNPNLKFVATMPYRTQRIAGLRNKKRLELVRPWEGLVDYHDKTDQRVARSLSEDLFSMFGIPGGESAGASLGIIDHYYSDLLEADALPEGRVAFFVIMDTFAPYRRGT